VLSLTQYEQVVEHVKSGYLLFFKPSGLTSRAITAVTGGNFSHVGMCVKMNDGVFDWPMVVEASAGGRRVVSLASYAHRSFVAVNIGLDYSQVAEFAIKPTGSIRYGTPDFIKIGIKELILRFGGTVWLPDSEGEVCSEFIAKMIQQCKLPNLVIGNTLLSPSMLFDKVWPPGVREFEYSPPR